ncbi:serine protease [Desulfonatronovibrio magnus]|uniref:serine protease n=1 Tax=Desulfonatronovibrio magnus TaxID=698827 RepID=UPI000698E0A8|nr:serine protease [Desulfonatronovibrio magnus]
MSIFFRIFFVFIFAILPLNVEANSELESVLPKIKGGEDADIADWPWNIALLNANVRDPYRAHFCGGTFISPQWIITAAHCLVDMSGTLKRAPEDMLVLTGRSNLRDEAGQMIPVKKQVLHPGYDPYNYDSDLALLYIEYPPDVATDWGYIPIIESGDPLSRALPGNTAWITGWGALDGDRTYPLDLQKASTPLVNQEDLVKAYIGVNEVTDNMIGAGPGDGSVDTCHGDSGGPLVVYDRGKFVLVGVTSWGLECGTPDVYGVYVRLSNYCDWIVEVTGIDDCIHADSSSSGGGCTVASTQKAGFEWVIMLSLIVLFKCRRMLTALRITRF